MTQFLGPTNEPVSPISRPDDDDCDSLAAVLLELDDDDDWEFPGGGGGSSRWQTVSFAYMEHSESAQMEEIARSLRAAGVTFATVGQSVIPERMLHEGRLRNIVNVGFSLPQGSPWCFEIGSPRDPGTWLQSREPAVAPDKLAWRLPLRSGRPPRLAAAANMHGPAFHKLEVQHAQPTSQEPAIGEPEPADRMGSMELGGGTRVDGVHWPRRTS